MAAVQDLILAYVDPRGFSSDYWVLWEVSVCPEIKEVHMTWRLYKDSAQYAADPNNIVTSILVRINDDATYDIWFLKSVLDDAGVTCFQQSEDYLQTLSSVEIEGTDTLDFTSAT